MADSAVQAQHPFAPPDWPSPYRPRDPAPVVVKRDLLPALSVLSVVGLLGIPLGWLWSRLAPPRHARVVEGAPPQPVGLESWHRFDDLAVFVLLALAAGVTIGAVTWLLRERRGPVMLLAAGAGSALAAWLMSMMGTAFAEMAYPLPNELAAGDPVVLAPLLETRWGVLAAPFGAAVVYGLLAAWTGRDDLGRRLG